VDHSLPEPGTVCNILIPNTVFRILEKGRHTYGKMYVEAAVGDRILILKKMENEFLENSKGERVNPHYFKPGSWVTALINDRTVAVILPYFSTRHILPI